MIACRPILAGIAREFQVSNYAEAVLWIVLGVVAALQAFRNGGAVRADLFVLAVSLVAFGGSDLVEAQTGAWWKPFWLLIWKGACVALMLILLARHLRRQRR